MLPLVPLALIAATAAVAALAAKRKSPDAAGPSGPGEPASLPPLPPPPGVPTQPFPYGLPPQIGPGAEDVWDAALPENYKAYVKEQLARQTNTTDLETLAAYFYTFGLVKTALLLIKKANSIHATKGEPLAVWPPKSPLNPGDSPIALPSLGNGVSPVSPPQPGLPQPGLPQPGLPQPGLPQPGVPAYVPPAGAPVDWAQAGLAAARAAASMAVGGPKPAPPPGVPQEWWDRAIAAAQAALPLLPMPGMPGSFPQPGIPTPQPTRTYPVGTHTRPDGTVGYSTQNGDVTTQIIATKFGGSGSDLMRANPGVEWTKNYLGTDLNVPAAWITSAPPAGPRGPKPPGQASAGTVPVAPAAPAPTGIDPAAYMPVSAKISTPLPIGGWILPDGRLAYVIQSGDYGEKIAKKFGKGAADVPALVAMNPGFPWSKGVPGMEVLLPPSWWAAGAPPTARPSPPAPAGSTKLVVRLEVKMAFIQHSNPALCIYVHPPIVKVTLSRRDGLLIAVGEIETPLGPLKITADFPEARVRAIYERILLAACKRRAAAVIADHLAKHPGTSSGWGVPGLKSVTKAVSKTVNKAVGKVKKTATKIASTVSKGKVLKKLAKQVTNIVKTPALAKGLGLITKTIPKALAKPVALGVSLVGKAKAGSQAALNRLGRLKDLAAAGHRRAQAVWGHVQSIATRASTLASTVPRQLLATGTAAAALAQSYAARGLGAAQGLANQGLGAAQQGWGAAQNLANQGLGAAQQGWGAAQNLANQGLGAAQQGWGAAQDAASSASSLASRGLGMAQDAASSAQSMAESAANQGASALESMMPGADSMPSDGSEEESAEESAEEEGGEEAAEQNYDAAPEGSDVPPDEGSDPGQALEGGQLGEQEDNEGLDAPGGGADSDEGATNDVMDTVAGYYRGYGTPTRSRHYDPRSQTYVGDGPTYFEEALVSAGDLLAGVPFSVAARRMSAANVSPATRAQLAQLRTKKIGVAKLSAARLGMIAKPAPTRLGVIPRKPKLSLTTAQQIHKLFPAGKRFAVARPAVRR